MPLFFLFLTFIGAMVLFWTAVDILARLGWILGETIWMAADLLRKLLCWIARQAKRIACNSASSGTAPDRRS